MSKAKTTTEGIVYDHAPLPVSNAISKLYEKGYDPEEAAGIVSTECEVTEKNGERMVVGMKKETDSDIVSVSSLETKPGEPTGEYFTGRIVGGEPELVEDGVGLPVLEDVGHPQVPELNHEYYPREMPHGNRTDLEVVTRTLSDPDYATLLIGETGVGKNVLLKRIFSICNWPTQRVNFGLGVDYESLVGRYAPSDDSVDFEGLLDQSRSIASQNGDDISTADILQSVSSQKSYFEFVSGILRQCARNGYAFVGDEINTVTGEVTSSLHGVTEERSSRELVVQDTSEVITPDKRFQFVGTMNPVDYAGTNSLNRAFQTRFYPIKIPYLEESAEVQILLEKSNLGSHSDGESIGNGLVALATRLRDQQAGAANDGGSIMTAVSSRDLIKIGNMISDPNGEQFMDPKSATKMILEGLAAPGDWTAISSVCDRHNFYQ